MAEVEFLPVMPVGDLPPGERLVIEVGRNWIVIFNVDGDFFAVDDCCTHEEYPLSEGHLDGHAIECAKHGAQFDVRDGRVLAPPAFAAVKTYPMRVTDDQLEIGVTL